MTIRKIPITCPGVEKICDGLVYWFGSQEIGVNDGVVESLNPLIAKVVVLAALMLPLNCADHHAVIVDGIACPAKCA